MTKRQGTAFGRDARGSGGMRSRRASSHTQSGGNGRGQSDEVRRHRHQHGARSGRRAHGERPYIEGRRACAEALDANVPIRRALLVASASDGKPAATLERLAERLVAAGVPVESVARARLDELSAHGSHQGIMLEVAPFAYARLDDLIASASTSTQALVVVLDHVSDEGNLGAVVRTAEVVGAVGVIIASARAAGVGVGAYKASAGAVAHVPIVRVANIATAVATLKDAGFWAVAATEHASDTVWDVPLVGRIALVMGSEGDGISRLVRERCDFACRLPQRGHIESLNVAQAATALCYEWLRRSMEGQDVYHG